MSNQLELWQFIAGRLSNGESVMLLVVAESSGSSPGRSGYKMAVAADCELVGSIGGGVMEVSLVEKARAALSGLGAEVNGSHPMASAPRALQSIVEQVHQKDAPNASGMICSGKQTVIYKPLTPDNANAVRAIVDGLKSGMPASLTITSERIDVGPPKGGTPNEGSTFEKTNETDFVYSEEIGCNNKLFIVGGGHCALALSELMSKMEFHISIFDDRPDLNTIGKNQFAHQITIIDSYETIGASVPAGSNIYVVVMTLGYRSDETVIRSLFDKNVKYFGVLGSKAKMKTLLTTLEREGFSDERLRQISTPIGLPINSQTPTEIAVSIAAEIISVKNS